MVQVVALELPPAKDEPLGRSPLRLVACQVRHTGVARLGEVSVGLAIHEAMGGQEAWRLEPVQTQTMRVTAGVQPLTSGGPPLEFQTGGWRLVSHDGRSTATVMADNFALETTAYPGWESFSDALFKLIDSACEVLQPEAELRLGLRYINRIEQPELLRSGDLFQWISEGLLGILRHPIGPGVVASQQQVQVDAPDGLRAVIQHGFFQDQGIGRLAYLMDIDTYRESVRVFDRKDLHSGIDALHSLTLRLFQSMITEQMYEYLRG